MLPDLRGRQPGIAPPAAQAAHDPVEARYRLLEAATRFLHSLAATTPLLLLLEDLQDADLGSLDLLAYFSRQLSQARVLVVGTYRDTEVGRTQGLARTSAAIRRRVPVDRVHLARLTLEEVGRLVDGIALQAGRETPRGLATSVYTQTEGNPLLVWEVMRQRLDADPSSGASR